MIAIAILALLHGDSVSSSRIHVTGREARVTFTFWMADLSELARLDPDRNGLVESGEWKLALPAIFAYLASSYHIDGCRGEGDLSLVPPPTALRDSRAPVTLRMRYVSERPLERLKVRCMLFHEHEENGRHVVELPGGRTAVFDRDRRELEEPVASVGFQLPLNAAAAATTLAGLVLLMARR